MVWKDWQWCNACDQPLKECPDNCHPNGLRLDDGDLEEKIETTYYVTLETQVAVKGPGHHKPEATTPLEAEKVASRKIAGMLERGECEFLIEDEEE